jgi:hypothetical protein
MSAQGDAELVRRGYEAFIAGDMEWLNEHTCTRTSCGMSLAII